MPEKTRTGKNVIAIAATIAATILGVRPAAARGDEPPAKAERKYLLERVDEAAVVQLYADGFTELPLTQKVLIWHLYQAALAGRDIYYDQRSASQPDHAHGPRGDPDALRRGRRRDARRDPPLHQAVLAQQRPLQPPDRA